MSIIPITKHQYQYSKVRFFEREHGTEFLKFELKQIKEFAKIKKQKNSTAEITGYVSWCSPPYFLLLPTTTVTNIYLICKVEDGLDYPDLNQFSVIRGKMISTILTTGKTEYILQVTNVEKAKPDFGQIKPDISSKDFVEMLFEKWRNVNDTTEQLVAQSLISSPTMASKRSGGFTLTLANFSKKGALNTFLGDINRFIPSDFTKNKSLSFKVPELAITSNLPKFGWDDNVANLDNIPKTVDVKLDRIPHSLDECSITLLKRTMGPFQFDIKGLAKSDYPIVLEQHIERKHYSYDVSPEIYKFILATRMHFPTVSTKVFNNSIEKNREKIAQFATTHESISRLTGNDQFLDLGHGGKPLSIYNIAASFSRAHSNQTISENEINNASKFYFDNLETIMDIQHDWAYDKISPVASMTYEERRLYVYLDEHPKRSINSISTGMNMRLDDVQRIVLSLLKKGFIFEPQPNIYSTIPID